jgi:hypothetical protein
VVGRLRWSVALSLLTLALVVPAPVAGGSKRASPPIKVHIALATDRVVAGEPIEGTVVFTNTTHKAVTVKQCPTDVWLAVGLSGRVNSYPFGSFLVGCPPSIRLRPGANRLPVNVITTYAGCIQPQPSGTPPSPIAPYCTEVNGKAVSPPLPPGRYFTKLHVVGLDGETQSPNQVTVTLDAPAQLPVPAPCAETPGTPKLVTVPNVVGLSSIVAAFPRASACLNAGYANPVGTQVISESPVAGSQVPEHSSVILTTRGTDVTVP